MFTFTGLAPEQARAAGRQRRSHTAQNVMPSPVPPAEPAPPRARQFTRKVNDCLSPARLPFPAPAAPPCPPQVDKLELEHHIFMTRNGRISMAGVTSKTVDRLAKAINKVMKQ